MDYFNNLGQLPTDEPMGYGISYLGIKPTAVGIVPIQPIQVQPIIAPVTSQPINIPKPVTPPAPVMPKPATQSTGITPQPISKPMQQTFTPQPVSVPEPKPAPEPRQMGPVSPDFTTFKNPFNTPFNTIQEDYDQMQNVEALPQSLQPMTQPQMPQQPKPKFNQLTNLLNKGQMK